MYGDSAHLFHFSVPKILQQQCNISAWYIFRLVMHSLMVFINDDSALRNNMLLDNSGLFSKSQTAAKCFHKCFHIPRAKNVPRHHVLSLGFIFSYLEFFSQ